MKILIQIVVVALLVGGLSAGGSFYWQHKLAQSAISPPEKVAEKSDTDDDEHTEAAEDPDVDSETEMAEEPPVEELKTPLPEVIAANTSFGPPVGMRPPYDADGDEAGDLISRLRARAISTSRQERRMVEREDAMKLIVEDLRREQAKSAKLRKRIHSETNLSLKAAQDLRSIAEAERTENQRSTEAERAKILEEQEEERRISDEQIESLRREKDEAVSAAEAALKAAQDEQEELKKQLETLRQPAAPVDRSGSPEETANLKKLTGVIDSMPAESTSKVLVELVEKGRVEAVVAVLNSMKPRKAAEVLSLISGTKPILAADLVERIKRLKKDAPLPADAAK